MSALQLKDPDGAEISLRTYLETALEDKQVSTASPRTKFSSAFSLHSRVRHE